MAAPVSPAIMPSPAIRMGIAPAVPPIPAKSASIIPGATPPSPSARAFRPLLGLGHEQGPAVYDMIIQVLDGLLGPLRRLELDKGESPGLSGLPSGGNKTW